MFSARSIFRRSKCRLKTPKNRRWNRSPPHQESAGLYVHLREHEANKVGGGVKQGIGEVFWGGGQGGGLDPSNTEP